MAIPIPYGCSFLNRCLCYLFSAVTFAQGWMTFWLRALFRDSMISNPSNPLQFQRRNWERPNGSSDQRMYTYSVSFNNSSSLKKFTWTSPNLSYRHLQICVTSTHWTNGCVELNNSDAQVCSLLAEAYIRPVVCTLCGPRAPSPSNTKKKTISATMKSMQEAFSSKCSSKTINLQE